MIFSKKFIYLVPLVILICSTITNCTKSNDESRSKVVRTSTQSVPSSRVIDKESAPLTRSIIKKPNRQSGSKRVKFADQVLDESIGAEPLDSNDLEIKSAGREFKQKPNLAKKNDASNFKSSLALISIVTALTLCLSI